jgi:hypothetical protein
LLAEVRMDAGVVAVVTGVAGMVGALGGAAAGGFAAVRGARIGAEKAFQGVQAQVRGQEAAEHRHWVREQRHQVCALVLQRMAEVTDGVAAVRSGAGGAEEALVRVGGAVNELFYEARLLLFWGPQDVAAAAMGLAEGSEATFRAMIGQVEGAAGAGRALEAAEGDLRRRQVEFITSASRALRDVGADGFEPPTSAL